MKKTKKAVIKISKDGLPFAYGDKILIRTVTMYQIGVVAHIGPDSITLNDASWVADVGRLSTALETGRLNEVEKVHSWVCVGRGAIVDVYPWTHPLPSESK